MLGLPRRGDALMRVVHRLTLGGYAAHDLEAHRAHDRHEEGHEHEGGEELEVHGRPHARHRAHQAPRRRVQEEEAGATIAHPGSCRRSARGGVGKVTSFVTRR